jgi:FlaA1/EpsC-like NDP-sugar epimerase
MSVHDLQTEDTARLRHDDSTEQLSLWGDRDLSGPASSVTTFPRRKKRSGGAGTILLGRPSYRWLLLIGDLVLVTLAGFISTWIRFGIALNSIDLYTIAWTVTLVLFPPTFYIFDLYNPERSFRSWETCYRSAMGVAVVGALSMVVFFFVPFGAYGRSIMVVQAFISWVFLNGWRWLFGIYFQKAAPKIPVIIIGAGECGQALYDLLKSPLSPYEIKGFVDDDPAKMGKRL